MKNLRTFSAALVLTLTLAAPAFAGTISCPVAPPPPPPSVATTASGTGADDVAGTIECPLTSALTLLQSILALF